MPPPRSGQDTTQLRLTRPTRFLLWGGTKTSSAPTTGSRRYSTYVEYLKRRLCHVRSEALRTLTCKALESTEGIDGERERLGVLQERCMGQRISEFEPNGGSLIRSWIRYGGWW